MAANDLDAPESTLEELERAGAKALSIPGDVSDEGSVREMLRRVLEGFGRVDVLSTTPG